METESLFYPSNPRTAIYTPKPNDDRTRLLQESWLQLHKSNPLVRCCPVFDVISKIRFNRAQYVIAHTYAKIRSKTMEVSVILKDEVCLRALFQLSYVLVSYQFSFFSFKAYEDLLTNYVLEIAGNPTPKNIKRERAFISIAESITKNLDVGRSRSGDFDPLYREIFELARDPIESEKRKTRVTALKMLYQGDVIVPKKKKRKTCHGDADVASSSSSSSSSRAAVISLASVDEFSVKESGNVVELTDLRTAVPNIYNSIKKGLDMLENNSRHYTAQTLEILRGTLSKIEEITQLQKSESELESELTKMKWVLQILKHMEFKDHVFSLSNKFVVSKLAETEVDKDDASLKILSCDPELLSKLMRKYMIHHHKQISTYIPTQGSEVEFSQLINSVRDSFKQLKNEMQLKLKELSGKIEFCVMVYEGTEVEQKLDIFYEKISQILLDLGLDLRFCRSFCSSLSSEMAIKFESLLDELEVAKFDDK